MQEDFQVISEPASEEEVLAVTTEATDAEAIVEQMEAKAQCCVNHLCGCK